MGALLSGCTCSSVAPEHVNYLRFNNVISPVSFSYVSSIEDHRSFRQLYGFLEILSLRKEVQIGARIAKTSLLFIDISRSLPLPLYWSPIKRLCKQRNKYTTIHKIL